MLYNMLADYRSWLETKYTPATAKAYYVRICSLLKGQPVNDTGKRLNVDKVLDRFAELEHKNEFSQAKNSFLHFCEFENLSLSNEVIERIQELETHTRKKYRKLKAIDYITIDNKIKRLKNEKLKLSFQMLTATGLRVSELAQITTAHCVIKNESLSFRFIAKGGNLNTVTLSKSDHPELYERLKELITHTNPERKIFYSSSYLQKQAKRLGFTCHDLRRAFAKLEYKKSRSKAEVKKKLRHSTVKTTNIYLNSKVSIERTKSK